MAHANSLLPTVTGAVQLDSLGFSLTHEHIMSNFGKAPHQVSMYDQQKLIEQVVPYLKRIKSMGVDTVYDCTANFFGRRVDLLTKISELSGIHIITNTGIYGAANDRYIPEFAYTDTAESISAVWVDEFLNGINGTDIKPGFIKLGFDQGSLSKIDEKLFEAGILAHKSTGLKLAVHTGNNLAAATLQLNLLKKHKVSPDAWIWVHANKVDDTQMLLEAASQGAWISFDGVNPSNIKQTIARLKVFQDKSLLHKVLLSHDGNGFPAGGGIRPFQAIMEMLLPSMLDNGFTQADLDKLMLDNPKQAFRIWAI
jgi:phosphotriesterase-related protein